MEDLRDFGKVIRVKSGLSVRSLTDQQKQNYSGAEVFRVEYDSPAFIAKLERKDILIKIAKRLIRKPADVSSAFQFIRLGESAKIEFMRNHQLKETTIKF
jgi:S1-C subfamily serine protease